MQPNGGRDPQLVKVVKALIVEILGTDVTETVRKIVLFAVGIIASDPAIKRLIGEAAEHLKLLESGTTTKTSPTKAAQLASNLTNNIYAAAGRLLAHELNSPQDSVKVTLLFNRLCDEYKAGPHGDEARAAQRCAAPASSRSDRHALVTAKTQKKQFEDGEEITTVDLRGTIGVSGGSKRGVQKKRTRTDDQVDSQSEVATAAAADTVVVLPPVDKQVVALEEVQPAQVTVEPSGSNPEEVKQAAKLVRVCEVTATETQNGAVYIQATYSVDGGQNITVTELRTYKLPDGKLLMAAIAANPLALAQYDGAEKIRYDAERSAAQGHDSTANFFEEVLAPAEVGAAKEMEIGNSEDNEDLTTISKRELHKALKASQNETEQLRAKVKEMEKAAASQDQGKVDVIKAAAPVASTGLTDAERSKKRRKKDQRAT